MRLIKGETDFVPSLMAKPTPFESKVLEHGKKNKVEGSVRLEKRALFVGKQFIINQLSRGDGETVGPTGRMGRNGRPEGRTPGSTFKGQKIPKESVTASSDAGGNSLFVPWIF